MMLRQLSITLRQRVCGFLAAGLAVLCFGLPCFAQAATPPGKIISNTAAISSLYKQFANHQLTNTVNVITRGRTPSVLTLQKWSSNASGTTIPETAYSSDGTTAGSFTAIGIPPGPGQLFSSDLFNGGEKVIIQLIDLDQNLDPFNIETVEVKVVCAQTGDSEWLSLTETAPESGIFLGYLPTYLHSKASPLTTFDGALAVTVDSKVDGYYTDRQDPSDTSGDQALVDPLGTVFDSSTGLPVNGTSITIIDMATGLPATVFGDDGSPFPSTVISGGTVADGNGNLYDFPDGGYRFPLMNPGNYRIEITPPAGWSAPSTIATAQLQLLPGAPWSILEPGSRGEPFELAPVPILHLDIPVDPASASLWVAKSAAKNVIAIGDFLPYQITVTNTSNNGNALGVVVSDHLPRGFRYRSGSARLDGAQIANPTISADSRSLTFALGSITPLQNRIVSYVVEIAAGAIPGEAINSAQATGQGGITSNLAKALVKVREDLFRSSSLIVGQVLDGCGPEAEGIPGVRIYLEDGGFVITDKDGLYHFEGVRPITHVVQLDTLTLPRGYTPAPCEENTRFAGQNFSQFVELQGGTMWRADFYAAKPVAPASGLAALTLTSTIHERQVHYRIEIDNEMLEIQNLKLSVKLPTALAPLPGTSMIDDTPTADPVIFGEDYLFTLNNLMAGARQVVTFQTNIPDDAAGAMVATAILSFNTMALKEQKTPEAVNRFLVTRTTNQDHQDFILTTHFDFGLADLKDVDASALAEFAQTISAWQIERIELVGHTDSVNLSKKTARLFKDNLGLSQARADTIAQALTPLLNLPAEKITSSGKGAAEPIADNLRASGRAKNRRVEIKIFLSKDRIESSVEPLQMDSGRQEVETNATLLRAFETDNLTQPVGKLAESSDAGMKQEKQAGIISPADATVLPTAISAVRIKMASKLKPVLLLDGSEIPVERIGFTMVDKDAKITMYTYIGVDFGDPGIHHLVLRGLDPFGNTRFEETVTIVRSGAVSSLRLLDAGENIADGKTPVRMRIELRDASGEIIPAGITLALKGGNLLPPLVDAPIDQSILKTEAQVEVDRDGWVEFLPVAQSGAYRTRLFYSDTVAVEVETYVKPQMRDWILVGIGTGTVGYNNISGNMESFAADDIQDDYYEDGRIAFFAKGKIKGEWLLTAAYDTAKTKQDKLHGTIDPDTYYTLYGDGTDQQYDAPSARKLYVKLERGQFYALFGDYDTGLTVTELARYSRSLNGFKSELKSRYFSYNAFASETSQALIRDEIPGDGTSGLYRLSRRDLLINSEKIVIETRDRFHSETIVKSVALSRHLDYDIDYDAGTLFFKEPIASRDQDFNPIVIVIDFEAMDRRDAAMNFGGRGALRAGENVEVGASYIHEGASGAKASLTAIDTKVKFGQNQLRAEVATSQSESGIGPTVNGEAYLAEISHQSKDLDGRIYVREQKSGFGLGQQRSSEAGSRKLGSDARYRLNDKFSISGEISRQSMLDTGAERDLGQVEIIYKKANYSLRTGLRQSTDRTSTGEINRSTQFLIGGNQQVSKRLNLRLNHDQAIFSEDDSADYPTRTLLGADYLITETVSVFVEQEFTSSDTQETDMTRAGLKASPWSGAQMQSTIQQQGSENGPRVFATTGLKQTWQLNETWSLDAGLDRSQTLRHPGSTPVNSAAPPASGSAEDFTALSFGANRKTEKWTLSNRIEYRSSDSEDKLGLYSGAEGEVRRGLALSGRFQLFDSQRSGGSRSLDGNLRLGAAYRPVQTRWILLDRLDYLFDREENPTNDFSNWRLVNNLNANFRPNRQTQLSFQYGAKYVQENIDDRNYNSFTDLIGLEARHDLTKKWDIGVQGQVLHSWQAHQSDYRLAPSVGYLLMKNMWLSGGYNLVGFQDADFSAADFTAQGPFVKFRFKFDQNSVRDALKQF